MASRGSRMMAAVALAAVAWGTTGCTVAAPAPEPTVQPVTPVAASGDGTFTVGTLSAAGTPAGIAEVAGVEVAVRELAEAGGVLGAAPRTHHRDSGNGRLAASVGDLIMRSVDVIVGPPAAAEVDLVLPTTSDAGVPLLAPQIPAGAGGAAAGGVFGMTAPPGARVEALAGLVVGEADGSGQNGGAAARDVAVLALDQASADSLAAALTAAAEGVTVRTILAPDAAMATTAAATLAEGQPDVVVLVLPAAEVAAAVIVALTGAGIDPGTIWLSTESTVDFSAAAASASVEGVRGVVVGTGSRSAFAARVLAADPAVTDPTFAAEAYDATIIAALAATVAGDDGGASIAQRIPEVTSGGVPCSSYAECLAVLETEPDIAYTGPSGTTGFDATGLASTRLTPVVYAGDGRFAAVTP